jgi:ATP-dependent RNA helicase DDX5/DBP2
VLIGSADLKANHRITQQFEFVGEHEKYPKLLRILEKVRAGGCCRGGMWYCRGTSWVVLLGVLQGMAGLLASGPGAQGTQA